MSRMMWRWVVLGLLAAPVAYAQDVTVAPDEEEVTPPVPSLPPPPPSLPPAPPTASPVAPPAAVAAPVPVAVPPEEVVSDRSVGIHIGVNLGLFAFDVHQGHLYGFASGNAGIPLVTNGQVGTFAIGLGYSTPLSRPSESMWFMDFFLEALPGWWSTRGAPGAVVGLGGGLGFRFLHRSGFTAGFKVPVFGAAFSVEFNVTSAESVGFFYLFNGVALPIVSFGYRF